LKGGSLGVQNAVLFAVLTYLVYCIL